MKELSCEMCGSTNVIRQDGLYVCQACGTKYSPEDAKNLMVEGVVKIDKSSEIENFKKLANRYYSNGEFDKAEDYYTRCIEIDPDDWESVYFKGFSAGYQSTLSNYRINETIIAAQNAINLVESKERTWKSEKFRTEILNLLFVYQSNIQNAFKGKNQKAESDVSNYLTDNLNIIKDTERLLNIFPPENVELNDPVATAYEMIVTCCNALTGYYTYTWYNVQTNKNASRRFKIDKNIEKYAKAKREEYAQKIKMLNPGYRPPATNKGGCYVATAVYGSYNCPEVWTLRRFRDQRLKQTLGGRLFIKLYYSTSPTLVKYFGNTKAFKNFFKPRLDKFVHKLQEEGVESTFYLGD